MACRASSLEPTGAAAARKFVKWNVSPGASKRRIHGSVVYRSSPIQTVSVVASGGITEDVPEHCWQESFLAISRAIQDRGQYRY